MSKNKYQIYIDVPQDEEWKNIEVEALEVEAETAEKAQEIAQNEASKSHADFYVWEVTEADQIQ